MGTCGPFQPCVGGGARGGGGVALAPTATVRCRQSVWGSLGHEKDPQVVSCWSETAKSTVTKRTPVSRAEKHLGPKYSPKKSSLWQPRFCENHAQNDVTENALQLQRGATFCSQRICVFTDHPPCAGPPENTCGFRINFHYNHKDQQA